MPSAWKTNPITKAANSYSFFRSQPVTPSRKTSLTFSGVGLDTSPPASLALLMHCPSCLSGGLPTRLEAQLLEGDGGCWSVHFMCPCSKPPCHSFIHLFKKEPCAGAGREGLGWRTKKRNRSTSNKCWDFRNAECCPIGLQTLAPGSLLH